MWMESHMRDKLHLCYLKACGYGLNKIIIVNVSLRNVGLDCHALSAMHSDSTSFSALMDS